MNKAMLLNQGSFGWYSINLIDIRRTGLQEILIFDEHEDDEVERGVEMDWHTGHAAC
jgi:hypothetical protein